MTVTVFQDIRARRSPIRPGAPVSAPPPIRDDFRAKLVEVIPALRAFSRSLCGDRTLADDLVQETLLKAWSGQEGYDPKRSLKTWTFSILHNVLHSHWRSTGRGARLAPTDGLTTAARSPDPGLAADLRSALRAVQTLPVNQQEALVLIAASGLTYGEVAAITGAPIGTVKSRVYRARTALMMLVR